MTVESLTAGLGGAIGCDYAQSLNRLYFVEYNGKLSRLDLLPRLSRTISRGSGTLRGTWLFDLDAGREVAYSEQAKADIWWQQETSVQRQMTPWQNASICYLGKLPWNTVNFTGLAGLNYSDQPINGDDNASNLLKPGAMFAVRTGMGNYAKVKVKSYGYNLKIRWQTYRPKSAYKVLGRGYKHPEDIVLSSDGVHAYVTERGGKLLRVDLSQAARSKATVLTSGMTAPHQMVLDEDMGYAWLVEYGGSGRLLRIDLSNGSKTAIVSGLDHAIGLAMDAGRRRAWVSEQSGAGGRIRSVDLDTAKLEPVCDSLTSPFFLSWASPTEEALYVCERDPANRLTRIDLTQSPPAIQHLESLPHRPSSVAIMDGQNLLACSNSVISKVGLTAAVYNNSGPYLLGVGHVPITEISTGPTPDRTGYATTDPGYFFHVVDAPFGGTVSLMVNHDRAYTEGARRYVVKVDGVTQKQAFNDYKWSNAKKKFVLTASTPTTTGMFRVRRPTDLWYNHWLGFRLNTKLLSAGLHTVEVRFYTTTNPATFKFSDSVKLRIDNSRPRASIDEIIHHLLRGRTEIVGTCGIVNTPTSNFSFRITAQDLEGHLKSWNLRALWGDNKSKGIASESYTPNPSKKWAGLVTHIVPPTPWDATVAGDPTSTRCAHTFYLTVWDRVTNGYTHLHRRDYHKSITIML